MTTPDEYGWRGDHCDPAKMASFTVGGSKFLVNKRAKANFELFVTRFDREVERVSLDGWDGGYACRAIRGSTEPSLHGWGLAVDLNASRHPLAKAGTFTRAQMVALRRLLKGFPEIRWGGDYAHRKDEQHFEIIKSPTDCAAAVKRRAGTPTAPRPTHSFPLPAGHWYGPESSNPKNHSGLDPHDADDIALIRAKLKAGGSGGRYDAKVEAAVVKFQQAHKLQADGLTGAATWAKIWTS